MSNPVVHWQIVTPKPEETERFYTELFDWKSDADNPLKVRQIATGSDEGIGGDIWPAPPEADAFVQLHVRVEDVDAAVAKAEALGARVMVPKQELPGGGAMAVLHDPQGLAFVVAS